MTVLGHRAFSAGAFFALVAFFANCANDDSEGASPVDRTDAAPQAFPEDAGDAGCPIDGHPCTETQEPTCEGVDWCPQKTSHPLGLGLASVWGSGPMDVWAVGAFGSVAHWDGKEWSSAEIDTHWSLRAVWGTGPTDVWTMAAANQIFHTTGFTNGAAKWSPVSAVIEEPLHPPALAGAIWGTAPGDIWVAGKALPVQRPDNFYYELAWRSVASDGGTPWAPVVQDYTFDTIRGLWGSGPGDIWIVGSKSDNLPFAAHSKGVAAADGGVPSWTELDAQTLAGLYAVWGSGPDDVWAIGDYGTIRHYRGDSELWTIIDSPTKENLRGIWGSGPADIWVVGESGTILHYDGTAWNAATAAFPPGERPHLYGVWGSGPTDVWAVGSGLIMHFSGAKPGAQGATP